MGDAADKLGRGGEEIAREKSERPRGKERGLGEDRGTRDTDCGAGRGREVCERGSGRNRERETGVRGWREHFSGPRGGDVPSLFSGAAPSPGEPPPFPLLDVKSPFHPDTLLNCCKNHL